MLYVSEIELKSLIIRIKNARITNLRKCYVTNADDSEKNILANNYIDNRVRLYNKLSNLSFDTPEQNSKLKRIRNRLKNQILNKSTLVPIDSASYELFGRDVMLIVERIITKSQKESSPNHSSVVTATMMNLNPMHVIKFLNTLITLIIPKYQQLRNSRFQHFHISVLLFIILL